MNLSAKTELLKRFSTAPHVAGLKSIVETAFGLGAMIDSAKKRAAEDPHLSAEGRNAHVSKVAQDNLLPLAQATAAARKMGRFNADRRAGFKPPTPPRDDIIGELKRSEIRAFVRELPIEKRLDFANRHPEAILDAPAELSGLPQDRFEAIRDEFIKSNFGPEIAEIEILDGDLATVRAAHDLALNELRANSGMSEQAFAKMVEKVTRETDGV
jgi:hypothetical protein